MKTIYIVLTDTGTLFTRLIKRFTKAPYNHASIALDADLMDIYSFGRKSLLLPWNAGFVRERRDSGLYLKKRNTTCVVYELKLDEEKYERVVKEIEHFQQYADRYTYNFVGLLNFLFPCRLGGRNSYFCSEFVATVLHNGGVEILHKPAWITAPHDFMSVKQLRAVYEGPLMRYRASQALA